MHIPPRYLPTKILESLMVGMYDHGDVWRVKIVHGQGERNLDRCERGLDNYHEENTFLLFNLE